MGSDFIIEAGRDGYVFVGWATGTFETDKGEEMPYYNMYVLSPVSSFQSENYQAFGWKAEKKKCISADVWKDLEPGSRVKLFFDDRKRVVMAVLDG